MKQPRLIEHEYMMVDEGKEKWILGFKLIYVKERELRSEVRCFEKKWFEKIKMEVMKKDYMAEERGFGGNNSKVW